MLYHPNWTNNFQKIQDFYIMLEKSAIDNI